MPVFWFTVFFYNFFSSLSFNIDFPRFLSQGSLDFSCQATNSVSSYNFCAYRKPSGCWLPITFFSLEFQPPTALLVLYRYWCIFHISMGTFLFCIIAGLSNREIRLISHSVEHCYDYKPTFFYFIDKQVCQNSTPSACQSDLFVFFQFHRIYLCMCVCMYVCMCVCIYIYIYTGCPRRYVPDFGRVFLMWKNTDITQNNYIQSWTVTEIMAREVWNFDSYYTLIDYQIHIKTGRNMWFL